MSLLNLTMDEKTENLLNTEKKLILNDASSSVDEKMSQLHDVKQTKRSIIYEVIKQKSKIADERPVCVLVLDGGGLRGVLTCQILKELEKKLNNNRNINDKKIKISDVFDVIIGTSTGGLISLGLGRLGWDVDDCINLYHKMAKSVFGLQEEKKNDYWYNQIINSSYNTIMKTWNKTKFIGSTIARGAISTYSSSLLEQAVRNEMKNPDLDLYISKEEYLEEKQPLVTCIATDVTYPDNSYPVLLRSYTINNNKITEIPNYPGTCHGKVLRAAMCTSAAPTYFDEQIYEIPHSISYKRTHKLVDGGLNANYPSMIAYCETQLLWPKRKIFMISIGTGQEKVDFTNTDHNKFASIAGIITNAFGSVFSAKEVAALCSISTLGQLGFLDVIRFNPAIDKGKGALDDTSLLGYWTEIGKQYADNHEDDLKEISEILLNCQNFNILNEAKM